MTATEKHAEYQTALIANDTASMNALWSEYLALVELEIRAKKRANENEINLLLHQAG